MRIVHVVEDLSEANTGITASVRELSQSAAAAGCEVRIVAIGSRDTIAPRGVSVRAVPSSPGCGVWRYSRDFPNALAEAVGSGAIVHVHGVWMYPQWKAVRQALSRNWPVVVSTHNMLGGWLWRRGLLRRIKKRIYFELFLRRTLSRVSIHALSSTECRVLANDFLRESRIETIPNALNEVGIEEAGSPLKQSGERPSRRYVVFLGRLHPVKGLPLLIAAFRRVSALFPDTDLVIAGPADSQGYANRLRRQIRSLGVESRVKFAGPLYESRKWELLRGAWVMCAPSYSEGMSMAALEAMACHVPVITTSGAGLDDVEQGGGLLVDTTEEPIALALEKALSWTPEERDRRGKLAAELVRVKYSWEAIWPRYKALYESLGNRAT